MTRSYERALIVGAGEGLSASLARLFAGQGLAVVLAARNTSKLSALAEETGALALACDAARPEAVAHLFAELDERGAPPDVVVYNPSARVRGPLVELDPERVAQALQVTAFGAFLVAQQAVRRMLPRGRGAVVFTGASAGVKGYPQSRVLTAATSALPRDSAETMRRGRL